MLAYRTNALPVKAGAAKSGQPAAVIIDNPILDQHAATIRKLGKRLTEDIIEIGRLLTESREILGYGNFLPWVECEFKWSLSTVERFIQVYRLSLKFVNLTNLEVPISGLYWLAAPSVPDEARNEVIERAASGERVSNADIKAIIDRHREPKAPAPTPLSSPILRPAWADGKIAAAPDRNTPIAPPSDDSAPIASHPEPPLPEPMPYPTWANPRPPMPRPAWAGVNATDPGDAAAEREALYADAENDDREDDDPSPDENPEREWIERTLDWAQDAHLTMTLDMSNRCPRLYELLGHVITECESQLAVLDTKETVS